MTRAFFIHERADVLGLFVAEQACVGEGFGADAAEFVAAAVDDGVAVGAAAFSLDLDATRKESGVV